MTGEDRPLRVLIFDRGLGNPYSFGLAEGLERIGVSVAIAGPQGTFSAPVTPVYPRAGVPGQKTAKALDGLRGIGRLVRLVARFRPDVLHFQWGALHDYAIARSLKTLTQARIVFTVHNPVPRGVDFGYRWQGAMVRLADVLIVHGAYLREELIRSYDVPPERVHVVPHGNFDHAVVRHDRNEARQRLGLAPGPIFAFFGQLQQRKGIDTLVEAFRLHCERGLPGQLVVAGSVYGVDLDDLLRRVEPFGERVRWLTENRALPAEVLDLVASAANLVVLPFHEASQSGSVLYAMTHGRCLVTTAVGELADTVGTHGFVVPPRDATALADVFEIAVQEPERCDEIGRGARAYVLETLDWGRPARLTLAAYTGVPADSATIDVTPTSQKQHAT